MARSVACVRERRKRASSAPSPPATRKNKVRATLALVLMDGEGGPVASRNRKEKPSVSAAAMAPATSGIRALTRMAVKTMYAPQSGIAGQPGPASGPISTTADAYMSPNTIDSMIVLSTGKAG